MPRQVTYRLTAEFIPWRLATKELARVGSNTARLRFAYFTIVMGKAVRHEFAEFNPCRDVKKRRVPPKEKEEITTEH